MNTPESRLMSESKSMNSDIKSYFEMHTQSLVPGDLGNDISNIVIKHIPIGTAFDDAESILKLSGFSVLPRPGRTVPSSRIDQYDVYAKSTSLITSSLFGITYEVSVQLRPDSPDTYEKVKDVSSYIYIRSL